MTGSPAPEASTRPAAAPCRVSVVSGDGQRLLPCGRGRQVLPEAGGPGRRPAPTLGHRFAQTYGKLYPPPSSACSPTPLSTTSRSGTPISSSALRRDPPPVKVIGRLPPSAGPATPPARRDRRS